MGRILDIPGNKDCAGLGYNSQNLKKQVPIAAKGKIFHLSKFFSSVGHLVDGRIYALEEEGATEKGGLVYQKDEGHELTNWIVFELLEVTMLEK